MTSTSDLAPESVKPLRLALAGGGTGGHAAPGLHLLEQLAPRGWLEHVLWLGSGRRAEQRALASLERRVAPVPVERVTLPLERAGGGAPSRLESLVRLPRAVAAARAALGQAQSEVLLGLGGFVSAPAVLAARTRGLPAVLLEVNAVRGLATRVLGPLSARVAHAWPDSLPRGLLATDRHRLTGPPLGPGFDGGRPSPAARARARRAQGFDPDAPLLVVLGGSQGAGALNRFTAGSLAAWRAAGLSVWHQVGPGRLGEAAEAGPGYRAEEFLDPILPALRAAELVLARAGAGTLAEIAALRVPSVLVPLPNSVGGHQWANARALGQGTIALEEARLDGEAAARIARLAGGEGAAERAEIEAHLDRIDVGQAGARRLAELLLGVLGRGGGDGAAAGERSQVPAWAPPVAGESSEDPSGAGGAHNREQGAPDADAPAPRP